MPKPSDDLKREGDEVRETKSSTSSALQKRLYARINMKVILA
jgi:hypothetical protein